MTKSDELAYFKELYNRVSRFFLYPDLEFEYQKIFSKSRKKFTVKEKDEFINLLMRYWRRVIKSGCNELKKKVNTRKTKGQAFNNNLKKVEEIERGSEKNLDIDKYEELLEELREQFKDIDEKISIEKYEKKIFWNQIIIGGIIGFVLGIMTSLLLKSIGF